MEIRVIHQLPDLAQVDIMVLPIWSDDKSLPSAFNIVGDGLLARLWQRNRIKVKAKETKTVYLDAPWPTVILLGLGNKSEFNQEQARMSGAALAKALAKLTCSPVLLTADKLWSPEAVDSFVGALVEGIILGDYHFERYRSDQLDSRKESILEILVPEELSHIVHKAVVLAEAVNLARDLVNEPSNSLTPSELGRQSNKLAEKHSFQCQVLEGQEITKLGMGGLLGIAKGSVEPPQLIVLSYQGGKSCRKIAFVGKGITFDAGGISLKPARGMHDMKSDMAGGAAVVAALVAIARLQLPVNVVGIVPTTENLPSASALKPGDIIRMADSTTVEVINTDAEGRLILADALAYAIQLGVDYLLDVATLSGACSIALGPVYSGLWSNDEELQQTILQAAMATGEKFWPMPFDQEYYERMKGHWADLHNSAGSEGGANNAAAFLGHFVGKTPWAHLDIAPTGYSDSERGYIKRGGTGVAVRTLVHLAQLLAK